MLFFRKADRLERISESNLIGDGKIPSGLTQKPQGRYLRAFFIRYSKLEIID
jgi:hypothetical protein